LKTTAPPYDRLDNDTRYLIDLKSSQIRIMNQIKLTAETEQREVQSAINNATLIYQEINQQHQDTQLIISRNPYQSKNKTQYSIIQTL
jgi:hypothetical protein